MSEQPKKRRRANANPPHWPTSNAYSEEVVGESFYKADFEALTIWPQGVERMLYALATLIPDPENQYDSNAVKVVVEGRHIGHLSKASALRYKKQVTENSDVYDPPVTTANIRIDRLLFDDGPSYSAALDLNFNRPPSDINKEPPRTRYSVALPKLRAYGYVQNGFLILLCPDMDEYTLERAHPGASLDVWQPNESDDVFLYVRSSVGGAGTVATSDMTTLQRAGFASLDDFNPLIHSVAGDFIIACAEIPKRI